MTANGLPFEMVFREDLWMTVKMSFRTQTLIGYDLKKIKKTR